MAKSSPPPVRRAFTLIELLVVIAGIGILLGIAIPSLNWAYERAKVTKDMSNLRQIGLGMQLYLNDKDGVLPGNRILRPGSCRMRTRNLPKVHGDVKSFPVAF